MNYFIRFDSPTEARANVAAAKKSTSMPVVLEANSMITEEQRVQGIAAAMDAYLLFGETEHFTIYRGQQIGKWNGSGPIYFEPTAVEACLNRKQVSLQRKGGTNAQNDIYEPVQSLEETSMKKRTKNTEKRTDTPIAQQVLVQVSISDEQIEQIAERVYQKMMDAQTRHGRKRSGRFARWIGTAAIAAMTFTGITMHSLFTAHAATMPELGTPIHLYLLADHATQIQYGFTHISGVTGYQVYMKQYGLDNGKIVYTSQPDQNVPSVMTHGLQPNMTYEFWMRDYWDAPTGGTYYGAWSNEIKIATYPMTWKQIVQNDAPSIIQVKEPGVLGSGFFIPGGYIVSCYHVVSKAGPLSTVDYRLQGHHWHWARIVSYSKQDDLALLKPIFAQPLSPLYGGFASHQPHTGQPVINIGYALGYNELIINRIGRVLATGQTMSVWDYGTVYNMLSVKTGSYQGDSGSPVINHYGNVVGVLENGQGYKKPTAMANHTASGAVSLATLEMFLGQSFNGDTSELQRLSSYGIVWAG